MNETVSASETNAEWSAAQRRLDSYLLALGVPDTRRREQMIATWLEAGMARKASGEVRPLMELGMDELARAQTGWLNKLLELDQLGVSALQDRRVGLRVINAHQRWPGSFLAADPPAEMVRELKECEVRSRPELCVSRMVPRPLDMAPLVEDIFHEDSGKTGYGSLVLVLVPPATTLVVLLFAMFG